MLWECECGHQFWMKFGNVKIGQWCPICVGHIKHTIYDCKEIAKLRDGECLSKNYIDNKTKMEWKCKRGHIWQANFNKILKGRWCQDAECIQEKSKKTFVENYGVDNPNKNSKVREKASQTCLERYGFSNPSQVPEFANRAVEGANDCIIRFHHKTGQKLICKGSWEANVVDYLNLNKYNYQWQPKTFTMPNNKTYRPDFYLPDLDIWVEVKGRWYDQESRDKWEWFHKEFPNSELWTKDVLKSKGIPTRKPKNFI
jgi:hypothetical protein